MTAYVAETSDTVQEDRILSSTFNSNRGQESNTYSVTLKWDSVTLSNPRSNRGQESNTYSVPCLNVGIEEARWTIYNTPVLGISTDALEIAIHRVPFDKDRTLVRCERKVLHADRSECGRYFIAEFEDLEMSLLGESMEELKDAFEAMLRMMWKRYVMGNPQRMTRGAVSLRKKLDATYRLA